MPELRITQIGNSHGFVVPKEIMTELSLEKGDAVHLSRTAHGFRITTTNPAFEESMKLARQIMKKRRNVLAELAK